MACKHLSWTIFFLWIILDTCVKAQSTASANISSVSDRHRFTLPIKESDNVDPMVEDIEEEAINKSDADRRSFETQKTQINGHDTDIDELSKDHSSAEESSELGEIKSGETAAENIGMMTPPVEVAVAKPKKSFIQKLGKAKSVKIPAAPTITEDYSDITGSYSSLGVQIAESLNSSENLASMSVSGLQWLMNVYNPFTWTNRFLSSLDLTDNCREDLKIYLEALKQGSVWAAKMTDASGRYNSQFFFGNDFWLGSHSLCNELQNNRTNKVVPPFRASFHVAKLKIKLQDELTPTSRLISLGMCLPQSCSAQDIKTLVNPRRESEKIHHSTTILTIRPVPGPYKLVSDPTFHLMALVAIVVSVLMVIGTAYEIILERRAARIQRAKITAKSNNNVDYELKTPPLGQIGLKHDTARLKMTGSDLSTDSKPSTTVLGEVVLAFSALTNGRKILHAGPPPADSLSCVHGLRFLSLAWVIMVHTYLQVFTIAENKTLRTVTERNFMFQTISNATFSVDTFFFLSGLLVTYIFFKTSQKDNSETPKRRPDNRQSGFKDGFNKFCTLLGYRYVRLTPAYMFVLGMAELSMRWLKNKSVFEPLRFDEINCDLYWWRNALYINSLFPMKDMCMLWSWYMANDTQFYVLAIIILLLSAKYARFSAFSVVFCLLLSWVVTILIAVQYQYIARIEEPFGLFDQLYDKPWTRLGPHLVGMFTGWYLFRTKCKVRMSYSTALIGWFISLLTLGSLVYGLHIFKLGITGSALYVSVGHSAWGAALAWIVIACCTGNGGCINSLLSFRLLQPLSRLTYCAYLVHPVIMVMTSFQMDGPLHLHNALVLILYFGNVVASFLISFCISMTLEAPVVRLLKVILSPPKSKNSSKM